MSRFAIAEPDMPWPSRTADLAESERLILGALRYWLAGLTDNSGTALSLAWNDLARALGAERARAAMSGLIGLVRAMGHLRRPLRHHRPCCACLSGDEMAILSVVSACQSNDWTRARGLAEWLILPEGTGGLLEQGMRLASVFKEGGLVLPARIQVSRPRSARTLEAAAATIH